MDIRHIKYSRTQYYAADHLFDPFVQIYAPPTFILKGVIFENRDGSQSISLKPQTEPRATKTSSALYACGGSFDYQPVIPWNGQSESVLADEFMTPEAPEFLPKVYTLAEYYQTGFYPMYLMAIMGVGTGLTHEDNHSHLERNSEQV